MPRLTPRQLQALEYISGFLDSYGRSPSASELASGLGLSHHTSGNQLLQSLSRKGLVRTRKLAAGRIETVITVDGRRVLRYGPDDPNYRNLRPVERLSDLVECMQPGDFLTTAATNAMADLDIRVGDILVVRPGVPIHNGEVCVVSVDGHSSTLRRVVFPERGIRLIPANDAFAEELILDRKVDVHGVVVARLRVRLMPDSN